jgi:hypothetical protein
MPAGDHGSGCPWREVGNCEAIVGRCATCPLRSSRPVEWMMGVPPSTPGPPVAFSVFEPGDNDGGRYPDLQRRQAVAKTEVIEAAAKQAKLNNSAIELLMRLVAMATVFAMGYLVLVRPRGAAAWPLASLIGTGILAALLYLLSRKTSR